MLDKSQLLQTWIQFNVYIVTWNVGTKHPECISLEKLLGLDGNTEFPNKVLPDIYAVGFQEVNSAPQNQLIGLFKEDPWTLRVKEVLKVYDYVVIKTEQMQGLLLSVFSKREHVRHMKEIEAEFTRTGFGGIWGNKGAVSIRLNVYGCGISFVVAHLAAHDKELDERIKDYQQILANHHYHVANYREIFDHEYVFWFGDLNFRLTGHDTAEKIRDLVDQNHLSELIQRDQLLFVKNSLKAFQELDETLPEFPPTFKFHENTLQYDMKRRPAWTDRILYSINSKKKQRLNLQLMQLSYKSHPVYNISDHKPVTSEFLIKIDKIPQESNVKFRPIPIWMIGEENIVTYNKPEEFEEKDHDWIGIYASYYDNLNEYTAYQYVNQASSANINRSTEEDIMSSSERRADWHYYQANHIEFSEDIQLKEGESYILIYFQSTGIRGVTSVSGISNAFIAEKRPPSPRFIAVD